MRIGDDTHDARIRQVPHMFFRLDRAVGGKQRILPLSPFRLLRQLSFGTKPIKEQCVARMCFKPCRIKRPERNESLIEELQLHIRIENCHRRRKLIERLSVALQGAVQFLTHLFHFTQIKTKASRACLSAHIGDIIDPAVAAHHSRHLLTHIRLGKAVALQTLTGLRAKKLPAFRACLRAVRGIHCARIGTIDPFDTSIGTTHPDRLFNPVQQMA
ncbi:hypothetical protein D9M72_535620 [compost metagenome]